MTKKAPDGVVIDINKMTRRQINEWRSNRHALASDEKTAPDDLDKLDFEMLYSKIIVSWPYGDITLDKYYDLPYEDSVRIDQAVSSALTDIAEKK